LAGTVFVALLVSISAGCIIDVKYNYGKQEPWSGPSLISDTRHPIPLPLLAEKEHRTVMLQHLETIQMIVYALAEGNYELAKSLTESHLSFFMHRQAMASRPPDYFPPAYHELVTDHHEATEALAQVIPTKDLKQILPPFNHVLKTCVACHLEFKLRSS
jgi:hypothetical protein